MYAKNARYVEMNHEMASHNGQATRIVVCHLQPFEDYYTMGMRKYYQTCSFEEVVNYCTERGYECPDFYWILASEFSFPEPREIK